LIVSLLIAASLAACSGSPGGPTQSTAIPPSPTISAAATATDAPAAASPSDTATEPPTSAPAESSGTATIPAESAPSPVPTSPAEPTDTAAAPGALPTQSSQSTPGGPIKTVFLIMMENHNWADIKDSPSAPYINTVLLPQASHAEQYYNPVNNHPSEPNYIWLEAGTNLGVKNDNNPSANHQGTTDHLVTLLNDKGISWKAYQEGISGKVCPLETSSNGLYAPKHNPFVFFDDVTDGNNPNSAYCIAHERPYSELATDLQNNSVARYNFITPDQCDDMHNSAGCVTSDSVNNGDTWLSQEVPKILDSQAYKDGGALFITWDEGENGSDGPIGMIVLSPNAKGGGYSNAIQYTHSATLRTMEEIFGVTPMLGHAAESNDLSDLFKTFP
jgi:hypothetical protein